MLFLRDVEDFGLWTERWQSAVNRADSSQVEPGAELCQGRVHCEEGLARDLRGREGFTAARLHAIPVMGSSGSDCLLSLL